MFVPVVRAQVPAANLQPGGMFDLEAPGERHAANTPVPDGLRFDLHLGGELWKAAARLGGAVDGTGNSADDIGGHAVSVLRMSSERNTPSCEREENLFVVDLWSRVMRRVVELHPDAARGPAAWLGRQLDCPVQTVQNWKVRPTGIPASRYQEIAKLLKWSVEELTGQGEPTPAWPFANVPRARLDAMKLNPGEVGQIEMRMLEALRDIERTRAENARYGKRAAA